MVGAQAGLPPCVWRSGADVYLLVVNGASEPATATVTLAGGYAGVHAEFGHVPERKGDGRLVYALAPLESVMVRLGSE